MKKTTKRNRFASECAKLDPHLEKKFAEEGMAIELELWDETDCLLRSPKNVERLLTALACPQTHTIATQTIDHLHHEVGLID